MRLTSSLFRTLVLGASLVAPACSQQFAAPTPPPPPPADMPAGPNITQQLANLADQPATHTGFAFDKNMLQLADGFLEAQGLDQKRAAAALHGITVDNFRYKNPAFYTPEAMSALIDSYHAAGWKHLVNANQTPANTAQPHGTATDMWLHFAGADIDGVTVLTRAAHMMNVVQVSCDLRPLDLVHLGGHFGIPKVDPDTVMVPAPR
jgi:hypothetical protein